MILLRKRRGKENFKKAIMLSTVETVAFCAFDYTAKRLLPFKESLDQAPLVQKGITRYPAEKCIA